VSRRRVFYILISAFFFAFSSKFVTTQQLNTDLIIVNTNLITNYKFKDKKKPASCVMKQQTTDNNSCNAEPCESSLFNSMESFEEEKLKNKSHENISNQNVDEEIANLPPISMPDTIQQQSEVNFIGPPDAQVTATNQQSEANIIRPPHVQVTATNQSEAASQTLQLIKNSKTNQNNRQTTNPQTGRPSPFLRQPMTLKSTHGYVQPVLDDGQKSKPPHNSQKDDDKQPWRTGELITFKKYGHQYTVPIKAVAGDVMIVEIEDEEDSDGTIRMQEIEIRKKNASRSRDLIINFLPDDLDEPALYRLFSQHGKVVQATIMKDSNGMQRGFGFIKYETHAAAARAVQRLNGLKIFYKQIKVSFCLPGGSKADCNLFVGTLPQNYHEIDIYNLFKNYGPILDIRLLRYPSKRSKRCGFVRLSLEKNACRAISELDGKIIGGNKLVVKKAKRNPEKDRRKKKAENTIVSSGWTTATTAHETVHSPNYSNLNMNKAPYENEHNRYLADPAKSYNPPEFSANDYQDWNKSYFDRNSESLGNSYMPYGVDSFAPAYSSSNYQNWNSFEEEAEYLNRPDSNRISIGDIPPSDFDNTYGSPISGLPCPIPNLSSYQPQISSADSENAISPLKTIDKCPQCGAKNQFYYPDNGSKVSVKCHECKYSFVSNISKLLTGTPMSTPHISSSTSLPSMGSFVNPVEPLVVEATSKYDLPPETLQWNINDVSNWIGNLGLKKYSHKFKEEGIDGKTLLDDVDVKLLCDVFELPKLYAKKIMHAISAFSYRHNKTKR